MNGKRKFSQAVDVMVNTCKNIVGYFDKVGVLAVFILFIEKMKASGLKKENKTQKPEVESKQEEVDKETKG